MRQSLDLATADGHDRYIPSDAKGILSAGHEGVYEWVAGNLVRPDTRFVDLGCGTGYGAAIMTAAGATFDGLDSSAAAIEYARAKYSGANVRFFTADLMDDLPAELVPRSYDVVFSSEVLEHVVDPFALVRVMARLAGDEGACFVGTPNRLWSLGHMPKGSLMARSHVMEFTPSALVAMLETAFDDVALMYRMFPDQAVQLDVVRPDRPRVVRGAIAFAKEVAPHGVLRYRHVLGRGRATHEWRPSDILWLGPDDPRIDMERCVGLAAVCRRRSALCPVPRR